MTEATRLRQVLPLLVVLAFALVFVVIVVVLGLTPIAGADPVRVREVQRVEVDGSRRPVRLPDEVADPSGRHANVLARYVWRVDLGTRTARQALCASGLLGAARLQVNGRTLVDEIGAAGTELPPRPHGRAALRLIDLPETLLRPGSNEFSLDLAGRTWVSLSPLWVGDRVRLQAIQDRRLMALVTGPTVVAAMIGCLGLMMLLLWARRPGEPDYAYFGLGAVLWSLHTLWNVAPRPVLPGMHLGVWWNTTYAAIVTLLVLFALHFAQRHWPRLERALLAALVLTPAGLYGAAAFDALGPASELLRLALVALAFTGLAVVARHAWHRRSTASAMFVLAGLAGAGLGLRDWWVFRAGEDNYPIALTPYASAPFILLVSWLLIDRFVRTADSLEAMNQRLEQRVAQREAQLAENFQRTAALERQQAAGDERQHVLRELHDGLGARLLSTLGQVERSDLDRAGLARQLRDCLADMHLATEALTPEAADLGALLGNLLFRWDALMRDAGVRPLWQVDLPEPGPRIAPYLALQLLRVVQEALNNVLRHAQASQVRLTLRLAGSTLALAIEDDGRGIDTRAAQSGRGLADMRTRAETIGASLALSTPPGGGTRLDLRLALDRG